LRWLFDDTRMTQLARDNGIGVSTACCPPLNLQTAAPLRFLTSGM
jgi:hypothetical protein